MASRETKEILDRLDNKVLKEFVVPPDPKAFQAKKVLVELKVPRVPKDTPVILVYKEFQAHQDLRVPLERRDPPELRDRKVSLDLRDPPVSLVKTVRPDLLDPGV